MIKYPYYYKEYEGGKKYIDWNVLKSDTLQKIPFRVRLFILEYFVIALRNSPKTSKESRLLFFGYFKEDRFRKVFLIHKHVVVNEKSNVNHMNLPEHEKKDTEDHLSFYPRALKSIHLHKLRPMRMLPVVEKVFLKKCYVTEKVLKCIKDTKTLKYVNFRSCSSEKTISDFLSSATKSVEDINTKSSRGTVLSKDDDELLREFKNVKKINIRSLRRVEVFAGTNLQKLVLWNSKCPRFDSGFKKLKILELRFCEVKKTIGLPAQITEITLECCSYLPVIENSVEGKLKFFKTQLPRLKNLKRFELNDRTNHVNNRNVYTGVFLEPLPRELEYIKFDSLKLKSNFIASLPPKLIRLDLRNTTIVVGEGELVKFPKNHSLKEIALLNVSINEAVFRLKVSCLDNLKDLECIQVSNVLKEREECFQKFKKLNTLCLDLIHHYGKFNLVNMKSLVKISLQTDIIELEQIKKLPETLLVFSCNAPSSIEEGVFKEMLSRFKKLQFCKMTYLSEDIDIKRVMNFYKKMNEIWKPRIIITCWKVTREEQQNGPPDDKFEVITIRNDSDIFDHE